MKTKTIYTETVTITTDDSGARTIERTHHADTLTEYWFTELSPEAQARAIADAIEEEADPAKWFGSHTYFDESEIIDAARALEDSQPVRLYQDPGCSWCGEARAQRWSYEAWEEVTEATDTGICWSMDICDRWNAYAVRIVTLQEAYDEAVDMSNRIWDAAKELENDLAEDPTSLICDAYDVACDEVDTLDNMAKTINDTAEALTKEAARAVGDVVDGLIEAQCDYYQSAEFWREWLSDSDDRYTRDGKRL